MATDERRLVTALFADISGFTTLADRLDPEQLVEVMDPVLSVMYETVVRYGGTVSKYAGDAVLAFFGAPVAHEDDAVRALRAALDMRGEVALVVAGLPAEGQHLTLHMGVNTGRVVSGSRGEEARLDYSVLGDAVNVAQRLEAASPSGEIYVGEQTYLLARDVMVFDPVGELTLKGKPEPVSAWRLVGLHAETGVPGAPGSGSVPTIGRDAEVEVLRAAVDGVGAGRSVLAGLIGEPGVGKTRLVYEAQAYAEQRGVRWEQVRCLSYGAGLAYRPIADLLRALTGANEHTAAGALTVLVGEATQRAGTATAAPYLLRVLGLDVSDGIPRSVLNSPEALRRAVQDAVLDFVLAMARDVPVVIAVEDVHWADPASLDVLSLLALRSERLPIGVLVTSRPEGQATIERLVRASPHEPVVLTPGELDGTHTSTLVASLLGAAATPSLAATIATRTRGNPLFVEEVVRSLRDTDALETSQSGWALRRGRSIAEVPDTVERVLAARIDLLPRPAADLLQTAAVLGRDVRVPLLCEVANLSRGAVDDLLGVLTDHGFLHHHDGPGGRQLGERPRATDDPAGRISGDDGAHVVFHHALVVDVAYQRLLRRDRQRLHRRALDAAEDLYGNAEDLMGILAHHAYHADMGQAALPYLTAAGDRAARLFANDEARTQLARAIEIVDSEPAAAADLPGLLLDLAVLERHIGEFPRALVLYERARSLTTDARAVNGHATSLHKLGRYEEALAVLDAAADAGLLASPEDRAWAAVTRGLAYGARGDLDRAVTSMTTALEPVRGSGTAAEIELLIALARTEGISGRHEDSVGHATEAARHAEAVGDLPRTAMALRVLGGSQHEVAEDQDAAAVRQAARRSLERALEIARQVGNAEEEAASLTNLGRVLKDLGDLGASIDCHRQASAAFERAGIKAGVATASLNLADALYEDGHIDEAEEATHAALASAEAIGHEIWISGAKSNLARVSLARDDPHAARTWAQQALAHATASGDVAKMKFAQEQLDAARAQLESLSG